MVFWDRPVFPICHFLPGNISFKTVSRPSFTCCQSWKTFILFASILCVISISWTVTSISLHYLVYKVCYQLNFLQSYSFFMCVKLTSTYSMYWVLDVSYYFVIVEVVSSHIRHTILSAYPIFLTMFSICWVLFSSFTKPQPLIILNVQFSVTLIKSIIRSLYSQYELEQLGSTILCDFLHFIWSTHKVKVYIHTIRCPCLSCCLAGWNSVLWVVVGYLFPVVKLWNLYTSPDIMWVIKSRMRWAAHVACMRDEKCIQNFGWKTWRKETTWKTYA